VVKVKLAGILAAWLSLGALAWGQAETLPPGLRLGTGVEPVPPAPFFVNADYLLWWMKPSTVPVPVLTTTRTPQDLNRIDPSLRNPSIAVLFGDQNINYPAFDGVRVSLGLAPSDAGDPGFQASGFFLPIRGTNFLFLTDGRGIPALILPFANTGTSPPVEAGAAISGIFSRSVVRGAADISSNAQMWSGEVGASLRMFQEDALHLDLSSGFRHLGYNDELTIQVNSFNGAQSAGIRDQFMTRNYFFGAHAGGELTWEQSRFSAQLRADLALGAVDEIVQVGGITHRPASIVRTRPGPVEVPVGFFSVSSLGVTRNTRFAVVPEVGLNVGWRVTDCIRLTGGYSFLYWSSVMRASDQINRNINQRTLPLFGGDFNNPPSPLFLKRVSDIWVQGLNAGLEITF
jgi:hypothetical protein